MKRSAARRVGPAVAGLAAVSFALAGALGGFTQAVSAAPAAAAEAPPEAAATAGASASEAAAREAAALDRLRRTALEDPARALATVEQWLAGELGPRSERAARLVGGACAARLGRARQAIALLTTAVTVPPPDADWATGVEAFVRALVAERYWYRAAQWSVALAVREPGRGAELMAALPDASLSSRELHYLGWQVSTMDDAPCAVLARLAELAAHDAALRTELAGAALAACGGAAPQAERLRTLAPGVRPAPIGAYDIAVVCPVTGRYARFGEALAQGAYLALQEANSGTRFPLRLRALDSRGDPLVAAQVAGRAVRAGVGALLGDLLTSATIAVAAAAEASGTPLVSPAATRSEIGAIGPHVFQTVVPREVQAEALARTAVTELRLTRLAILHPDHPNGRRLADRFERAATRLGGAIVARTAYPAEQTNFALELEPMAELMPDAVFIPGTPKELMAVVPQFSYYEVDTRVLALEELGLAEVLQATRDYLSGAVFSDSYYRVPDRRLAGFRRRYQERYGREPDPYATRGYVAMSVLARAVHGGARSHAELTRALENRVVRFGSVDDRGILLLGETEGEVALFEVNGAEVVPLD